MVDSIFLNGLNREVEEVAPAVVIIQQKKISKPVVFPISLNKYLVAVSEAVVQMNFPVLHGKAGIMKEN